MTTTEQEEIQTLCEMIESASDHVLERYDSERDRFISRARELARIVRGSLPCPADERTEA